MIDTNVWLDWLLFGDPATSTLDLAYGDRRVEVLASCAMRQEFGDVLSRDVMDRPLHKSFGDPAAARTMLMDRYDERLRLCPEPPAGQLRPTDPDDQVFIDLAIAQRASWLLTRDRALLRLARRAWRDYAVRITVPAEFRLTRP